MGLLQYANLGLSMRFDRAQQAVYQGLGDLLRYLWAVRGYLDRPEAVRRIEWAPAKPPQWAEPGPGYWVRLIDRGTASEELEQVRAAFLDEGAREVYERSPPQEEDEEAQRFKWRPEHQIGVRDRDPRTGLLLLDRAPTPDGGDAVLALRPNTYTINRQIQAIQKLQDSPTPALRPLIQLLLHDDDVAWPQVAPAEVETWHVLTKETRAGTLERRDFVRRALATPDFALLEGPPGSGKTTAICELVLQLVAAGKRVLLCASTHVAVDNVLERMIEHEHQGELIAVRIGDVGSVSDAARGYCLHHRVETERRALRDFLDRQRPPSPAQRLLRDRLRSSPTAIERLVLDSANLVCGTTIGILQHPDIRGVPRDDGGGARRPRPVGDALFDMMILDEASKTTFQEFLVPAVFARRWVIVGDPKQLSPYVETEELAVALEAAVGDPRVREACVDVFAAQSGKGATLVVTHDPRTVDAYRRQAAGRGAVAATADAPAADLEIAEVVLAGPTELPRIMDRLPLDLRAIRDEAPHTWRLRRRMAEERAPLSWADEVAWRVVRGYEQRLGGNPKTVEHLRDALERLAPVTDDAQQLERYRLDLDAVRRVALPSVIELLRHGFEGGERRRPTTLNRGFLDEVLAQRRVLLRYQHRMHPDIARGPREVVYDNQALQDAPDLAAARAWSYPGARAVWVHVDGRFMPGNVNEAEAEAVMAELRDFVAWTRASGPRSDGRAWEVAVLTFYRGQERAMRQRLRDATGQRDEHRSFRWRGVEISLCTVDRFQGHEADLVLLTFANPKPTNFLESQNRLNVALTRARYGLRVFGNLNRLGRSDAPLLASLQALPRDVRWQGSVP